MRLPTEVAPGHVIDAFALAFIDRSNNCAYRTDGQRVDLPALELSTLLMSLRTVSAAHPVTVSVVDEDGDDLDLIVDTIAEVIPVRDGAAARLIVSWGEMDVNLPMDCLPKVLAGIYKRNNNQPAWPLPSARVALSNGAKK